MKAKSSGVAGLWAGRKRKRAGRIRRATKFFRSRRKAREKKYFMIFKNDMKKFSAAPGKREVKMLSDIEIAQQAKMLKISQVAASLGIAEDDIEHYGHYKAKLSMGLIRRLAAKKPGKLVLVTAITPTPAGERRKKSS